MKAQRGRFSVALLAALLAATAAAAGQDVRGPLDEAGAAPGAAKPLRKPHGRASKHAAKSAAGAAHDAAVPGSLPDAAARTAAPTSRADRAPSRDAADPVSFGFKWQGSNDTAEKTRVQNYNGDAAGTGAAVGLKLHF